ncbi:MAG: Calx-beta domain-containing protein [bacterium]
MPIPTNKPSTMIRLTRSSSMSASSKKVVLPIFCAMSLTALSTSVYAEQWVKPRSTAPYFVSVGDTLHIQPEYSVTDPQFSEATGLGLRLHFASDALAFQQMSDVFEIDSIGDSPQPSNDSGNQDGDDSTDSILVSTWLNINAKWPGEANLPTLLYKARFTVQDALTDATTINFTASSHDARTSFQSEPFVICRKPTVRMRADKTELNEGEQALLSFELSPALPVLCGDITIPYTLTGEAENGVDFKPLSGELRFPAGEAVQQITLESINDGIEEAQESINLTLTPAGQYELANEQVVTLTILADNKPVTNEPVTKQPVAVDDTAVQNADPTGATNSLDQQQGEGEVVVKTPASHNDKETTSVDANNTGDKETVEVLAEDEKQAGDKETVEVIAEDEKQAGDKPAIDVVTGDKKPNDEPPAPSDEQVLGQPNPHLLETTTHKGEPDSESDSASTHAVEDKETDDKKALEAVSDVGKISNDYPEEEHHIIIKDKTNHESHDESGKAALETHHTTTVDSTQPIPHDHSPVNVPVDSPWMLALLSGLLALLGRFGQFKRAFNRD